MLILQDFPNVLLVVGGDFNCRLYNLNQLDPNIVGNSSLFATRTSLDNDTDKRGKLLLDVIELNGFVLLHGRTWRPNGKIYL